MEGTAHDFELPVTAPVTSLLLLPISLCTLYNFNVCQSQHPSIPSSVPSPPSPHHYIAPYEVRNGARPIGPAEVHHTPQRRSAHLAVRSWDPEQCASLAANELQSGAQENGTYSIWSLDKSGAYRTLAAFGIPTIINVCKTPPSLASHPSHFQTWDLSVFSPPTCT